MLRRILRPENLMSLVTAARRGFTMVILTEWAVETPLSEVHALHRVPTDNILMSRWSWRLRSNSSGYLERSWSFVVVHRYVPVQRLECEVLQRARYINTLTFTFTAGMLDTLEAHQIELCKYVRMTSWKKAVACITCCLHLVRILVTRYDIT